MRFFGGVIVAVTAWAVILTGTVSAKPRTKTKYTYYTISGKSARNLYQQMVSRGPHVSGDRALAATSVTTQQTGELGGTSSCRVRNYKLSMDFTIRLPKVRNEKGLPPRLRRTWKAFYKFVRRHEQRHRTIWIGCAANIEKQVRKIRASSCSKVDRLANSIFKKVSSSCERKHDAFDLAEQKRLARHPLVVAAKRVPRKTRTANAKRRKGSSSTTKAFARGRAADDF